MAPDQGTLRQWTERFTVASAASLVASLLAVPLTSGPRIPVLVTLFGFVCPMVFGMAYLLLPPYLGRTLVDYRLPGVHFVLAYLGAGLLVAGSIQEGSDVVFALGAGAWTGGIGVFVGTLSATVHQAILEDPPGLGRGRDGPQRSTRLASAMIPVAIGYLVAGTVLLLGLAGVAGTARGSISQVVHLYAAGFGALLIYSLGARLLLGFYHVTPPRALMVGVLIAGAIAPAMVGPSRWLDPIFRVGASLEVVAMGGYALAVGFVARRTDRQRFGLLGIGLGALAGLAAVAVAAPLAFGTTAVEQPVVLHRLLVLWGFFPLTIIGYAFLFFPVTQGQFTGATRRWATLIVALLAVGVFLRALGTSVGSLLVGLFGVGLSVLGALGYLYVLVRRFYG
jgi:hypothetical protein